MGLWCLADREGRFVYDTRLLAAKILPREPESWNDCIAAFDQLIEFGCIESYKIDEIEYGVIPRLNDYQKIPDGEAKSILPPPIDLIENNSFQLQSIKKKVSRPSSSSLASNSSLTSNKETTENFSKEPNLPAQIARYVNTFLVENGFKMIREGRGLQDDGIQKMLDSNITFDEIKTIYAALIAGKLSKRSDFYSKRLKSSTWFSCITDECNELLRLAKEPAEGEKSKEVLATERLFERMRNSED